MVIVKLVFMTANSLIHNFGQYARIGVRFGPLFSSPDKVLPFLHNYCAQEVEIINLNKDQSN